MPQSHSGLIYWKFFYICVIEEFTAFDIFVGFCCIGLPIILVIVLSVTAYRSAMRNRQHYEQEYWCNLREFEKFKRNLYKDDNNNTSK